LHNNNTHYNHINKLILSPQEKKGRERIC
jgi:hypothetical protein